MHFYPSEDVAECLLIAIFFSNLGILFRYVLYKLIEEDASRWMQSELVSAHPLRRVFDLCRGGMW